MSLRRSHEKHVSRFRFFAFLDDARKRAVEQIMMPVALAAEFPGLRIEEAKAVLADWRLCNHRSLKFSGEEAAS